MWFYCLIPLFGGLYGFALVYLMKIWKFIEENTFLWSLWEDRIPFYLQHPKCRRKNQIPYAHINIFHFNSTVLHIKCISHIRTFRSSIKCNLNASNIVLVFLFFTSWNSSFCVNFSEIKLSQNSYFIKLSLWYEVLWNFNWIKFNYKIFINAKWYRIFDVGNVICIWYACEIQTFYNIFSLYSISFWKSLYFSNPLKYYKNHRFTVKTLRSIFCSPFKKQIKILLMSFDT